MHENLRYRFPRTLRYLIDEKGIRACDVAAALGVSKASVSNWVNGVKFPRLDTLEDLADYFNVSIIQLLGLDDTN